MTRGGRLAMFGVSAAVLAAVLVIGFGGLPSFGHYGGVYGNVVNGIGVGARHATDMVTALNFDIRGFDTLGEEFILFGSVVGVVLILREMRGEHPNRRRTEADEHHFAGASAALRSFSLALVPALIAIGVYIVVHGHVTPGGGFQAGLILAAGPLAVFLAGRYLGMKRIAPHAVIEAGESIGAAGYALVGLGGLVFAGIFFKNFLPFGMVGHLFAAGQMPLASIAVGLEVAGAFLVAWTEFLDQAMITQGGSEQ